MTYFASSSWQVSLQIFYYKIQTLTVKTCQWIPPLAIESSTHHSYNIHFNISPHLFYSNQMVAHLEISLLTHCLHFLIPSKSPTNPILHHLIIWTLLQHHGSYIHISMTQIWWPFNRTTRVCLCVCVWARAPVCVCIHACKNTLSLTEIIQYQWQMNECIWNIDGIIMTKKNHNTPRKTFSGTFCIP